MYLITTKTFKIRTTHQTIDGKWEILLIFLSGINLETGETT
jgi:hypothetical protein